MANEYNDIGYDDFGNLSEASIRDLPGSIISRSKFNPYAHPVAYSLRMATFTNAMSVANAGVGGLYMRNLFRPYAALLAGATTPLGAAGWGALASLSADPENFETFAVQSYLFGKLIGTRHGPQGGGIARMLRWGGFDRQAAAVEKAAKGPFIVGRGLFGELNRFGMYVPQRKAYARLFEGLPPALPDISPEAVKGVLPRYKTYSRRLAARPTPVIHSGGFYDPAAGINVAGMDARARSLYERKIRAAYPVDPATGGPILPREITVRRLVGGQKGGMRNLNLLPTKGVAADRLLGVTGRTSAKDINKYIKLYQKQVTKDWTAIMQRVGPAPVTPLTSRSALEALKTMGRRIPGVSYVPGMARRPIRVSDISMGTFMERLIGATSEYSPKMMKDAISGKYAAGISHLYQKTALGGVYWDHFNMVNRGGAFLGELRLMRKGYRNQLYQSIKTQVADVADRLADAKTAGVPKLDLAKIRIGGQTMGADKASTLINRLKKMKIKGVQFKGGTTIGISRRIAGDVLTSADQIKSAVDIHNRIIAGTDAKAFSSYLWLALGFHYGKKAVGGLVNAAAKGIEAGSRLTMQLTHLEFGTGKSLYTQQASTERTRALQAIQFSGLNARSYLGRESQIYAR